MYNVHVYNVKIVIKVVFLINNANSSIDCYNNIQSKKVSMFLCDL